MAITRSSLHKRRASGGRRHPHQKKRKYSSGRPPAMTKLGPKRIHLVRARGGNLKYRALRLESGNFSWGGESITKKTRILDVVYNASNNELVRTKTLVKNAVVVIDATPFKAHLENKKKAATGEAAKAIKVDPKIEEQFLTGRVLAAVASRPGQSGRADGYVLEGPELEFYQRKIAQKKSGKNKA